MCETERIQTELGERKPKENFQAVSVCISPNYLNII